MATRETDLTVGYWAAFLTVRSQMKISGKLTTGDGLTTAKVDVGAPRSIARARRVGFGKAFSRPYPTVFIYGTQGGVEGLYRSCDFFATASELMSRFAHNSIDKVGALCGNRNIFGRVYVGGPGSVGRYGDYGFNLALCLALGQMLTASQALPRIDNSPAASATSHIYADLTALRLPSLTNGEAQMNLYLKPVLLAAGLTVTAVSTPAPDYVASLSKEVVKAATGKGHGKPTPAPSPAPSPSPSPTPTPTPSPTSSSDPTQLELDAATGMVQASKIGDGLTTSALLGAVPLASSNAPDVVGAFRFLCPPSHISYDDPIVHPGQPGTNEHLHIFFGNTETNASSTYRSLRQSGDSTCRNILNRSAYWQPAMIGKNTSGQEVVIVEDYTNFYYKARPVGDPNAEGKQVPIPRGLKFVFGGMGHPARFKCLTSDGNHNVTGWLPTLTEALALCGAGQKIDMAQSTPECWDGRNLDSPDHRSHMSFMLRDKNTGKEYCPATHPYLMPRLHFQRIFTIRPDDITTTWRLSSDMPGDAPGSMAHADYMMGWNDETIERWMAACVNKLLTCSDGNLGDGSKMVANRLYKNAMAVTSRRVPIPARGQVVSLLIR